MGNPLTTTDLTYGNNLCGSVAYFCPTGSFKPSLVGVGHYSIGGTATTRTSESICKPGNYCINGVMLNCPAGRYGTNFGEVDSLCEGECLEGFYCPLGSISPKQIPSGDPGKFTRLGASTPEVVREGYYSTGGTSVTRTNEVIAMPGYFAKGGILFPCPASRYGKTEGLSDEFCSGDCEEG